MGNLRILSYNIHKGFSGGIKKFTLEQMRSEIRRLHPDIIFLQEVHGHHSSHKRKIAAWPEASQFEYLAEDLWPHFSYGKNAVYNEGNHGNAILSKFRITKFENFDISTNRLERRGLLHTVMHVSDDLPRLHALCVHLSLLEVDRKRQLNQIAQHIESSIPADDLILLAGDFNDWAKNATGYLNKRLRLSEGYSSVHGSYARTFPAFYPLLTLDRVYGRGFKFLEAHCHSGPPWNELSDHAPLDLCVVPLTGSIKDGDGS